MKSIISMILNVTLNFYMQEKFMYMKKVNFPFSWYIKDNIIFCNNIIKKIFYNSSRKLLRYIKLEIFSKELMKSEYLELSF